MPEQIPVWLSSYPRSGNTLLRTILWHCFGLRSASRYLNDLGGNKELGEYIGHIDWRSDTTIQFPDNNLPFFKTHEMNTDQSPAIYVIRDGRAVAVSFHRFYGADYSLAEVIEGERHQFGTWSSHVESWNPWDRPNTLLLRYEDMNNDLPTVLQDIGKFIGRDIQADKIPDRNLIAGQDGRWVRKKADWQTELSSGKLLDRFLEINGDTLRKAGYLG